MVSKTNNKQKVNTVNHEEHIMVKHMKSHQSDSLLIYIYSYTGRGLKIKFRAVREVQFERQNL